MSTEELEVPDRILTVFAGDGTWSVDPDDERALREARRRWLEHGADSLIDLTTYAGSEVTLSASQVTGWHLTTRAQRRQLHVIWEAIEADRTGAGEGNEWE